MDTSVNSLSLMPSQPIRYLLDSLPDIVDIKARTACRKFVPQQYYLYQIATDTDSEYVATREFLFNSQWWSQERLEKFQRDRLNDLLRHAYNNVPYYRDLFDNRGLKPADIDGPSGLSKLPCLTKKRIRENYDDLQASNVSRSFESSTSGSTGDPFRFKESEYMPQFERAFISRVFEAIGCDLYNEKTIWLRSYVPAEDEPIYDYVPEEKRLYLSPYHLSPDSLADYVNYIESYDARTLVGYPSSIYIFALLLSKSDLEVESIDAVHTASENLLSEWRNRIKEALEVPVSEHYGLAEKVSLFHQCHESEHYHENLEYGVTEIDPETNEVIGTNLWNYAMPLIRYRTGDKAQPHKGKTQCDCGRGLPLTVSNFEGRTDDILETPDGRMLPGVNFYTLMYETQGVEMFQIVQNAIDKIIIKLVTSDTFDKSHHSDLQNGLRDRLGQNVVIEMQEVEMISRDKSTGKVKTIINNLG